MVVARVTVKNSCPKADSEPFLKVTSEDFSPSSDGPNLLVYSVTPQRCGHGLSSLPHARLFAHSVHVCKGRRDQKY